MRLIDADKIDFREVFKGESDFAKVTREAAQELINNQPTAYDVDKVVEQLKHTSQDIALLYHSDREPDYEYADGLEVNRAIGIVKSGGIEGREV